jgi:hypothetical protein
MIDLILIQKQWDIATDMTCDLAVFEASTEKLF